MAYNEVVIGAPKPAPRPAETLRLVAGALFSLALALVAFTPVAGWWFEHVMGLDEELAELSSATLWIAC